MVLPKEGVGLPDAVLVELVLDLVPSIQSSILYSTPLSRSSFLKPQLNIRVSNTDYAG